jgi:hypothetical protein
VRRFLTRALKKLDEIDPSGHVTCNIAGSPVLETPSVRADACGCTVHYCK